MTRDNLLDLHLSLCGAAYEILKTKNHDYTGGSQDPFLNFRHAETLGVRAELGLLIRVLDKIMRLQTFVNQGQLLVNGEGTTDSIVDIINYMVLLAGLIEERRVAVSDVGSPVGGVMTYTNGTEVEHISYGGTA